MSFDPEPVASFVIAGPERMFKGPVKMRVATDLTREDIEAEDAEADVLDVDGTWYWAHATVTCNADGSWTIDPQGPATKVEAD